MQVDLVVWTTDVLDLALHPMYRYGRPDTRRGALTRCQRCDIPLGSQLCPNPQCLEPHGQRVGNLCAWCYDNMEEHLDAIDAISLRLMECAVLQCASTHMGGGGGSLDDVC